MTNNRGLKWRAWVTLTLIVGAILFTSLYKTSQPIIDGRAATAQVNGGDEQYVASQYIMHASNYFPVFYGALLLVIWLPFVFRKRYINCGLETGQSTVPDTRIYFDPPKKGCGCSKGNAIALAFSLVPLFLVGCMGPPQVDVFETVGPNETAFVIPLQGDNKASQATFNSASFLETKKVAAKRIQIPTMKKITGRYTSMDFEWIPAVVVFKVDRGLISREWTSGTTGTSPKNQGIPVVTKDSIQLTLGCAVTDYIEEQDAATYLYYHGLQKLADVTDNNVRNFCISELTREYGNLSLSDAKTNGPAIFAKLFADAKAFFKEKGITISQLGNAEGYQFQNPDIQKGINLRFLAEQDIQTASQEKLAQDMRNLKILATAETTAAAAKMIFAAADATKLQNQLDITLIQAKAQLLMASNWNGALPANILPANSPLLLNLGAASSTNAIVR